MKDKKILRLSAFLLSLILFIGSLGMIILPEKVYATTTIRQGNKIVNTTTSETLVFSGSSHESTVYAGEIKKNGETVLVYLYSDDITRSSVIFDNLRKALPNPFSDMVPPITSEEEQKGLKILSVSSLNNTDLNSITGDWKDAGSIATQIYNGNNTDAVNANMYDVNAQCKADIDDLAKTRTANLDNPIAFDKRIISHVGTQNTDSVSFRVEDGPLIEVHDVTLYYLCEATSVIYTSVNVVDNGNNDAQNNNNNNNNNPEAPNVNPDRVGDFVERMYVNVLKRASEADGKAYWSDQLLSGKNCGAGLAIGFILSTEFTSQNVSNEDFVDTLYLTFFNRPADEGGRNNWLGELSAGKARTEVLAGFVNSKEFGNLCDEYGIARGTMKPDGTCKYNEGVRNFVLRCYSKVLGRTGETEGVEDWCNRVNSGELSMRDVAVSFLNSREFLDKGLNNEEYVKVLYRTFLGREADEGGLNDWKGQLDRGEKSRDDIVSGFSGSVEFSNIMAQYQ